MDFQEMFKIEEALQQHAREQAHEKKDAPKRRQKSLGHMFTHRPVGPVEPQLFCIAKMKQFRELLPDCGGAIEMLQGFQDEEMYLVTETVIRNNRELLEFHNLDNRCPRCTNALTRCACRDLTHIEAPRLAQEIHLAIRKLYLKGFLSIVYLHEDGLCTIRNAREKYAPQFFPIYGMGTGFSIYAENYHLKPPD
jgi:hypothetical protein